LLTAKSAATNEDEFCSLDHLEQCMAVRAAYWLAFLGKQMAAAKKAGRSTNSFTNETHAPDIYQLSECHMMLATFKICRNYVERGDFKDENLRAVLTLLLKVFALRHLQKDSMPCFEAGFFGKGSLLLLNNSMKARLVDLRPHMIPLNEYKMVMDDHFVNISAIGNKYGDIYESQLNWAIGSRLNRQKKPHFFESLVMPMIRGELPNKAVAVATEQNRRDTTPMAMKAKL